MCKVSPQFNNSIIYEIYLSIELEHDEAKYSYTVLLYVHVYLILCLFCFVIIMFSSISKLSSIIIKIKWNEKDLNHNEDFGGSK